MMKIPRSNKNSITISTSPQILTCHLFRVVYDGYLPFLLTLDLPFPKLCSPTIIYNFHKFTITGVNLCLFRKEFKSLFLTFHATLS